MPRVVVTEGARDGLERCRLFLVRKDIHAAKKAAQAIAHQFTLLEKDPEIGRPFDDMGALRERVIPFGKSGYVTLYRFD